jgi:hypothetical protein
MKRMVTANGMYGWLHSINYDKKTALVEMDYELVEYPWSEIVV